MAARTPLRVVALLALVLGLTGALAGTAAAKPPWWTPPGGGVPPEPPDPALDLIASWDGSLADAEGLCYTIALPNRFDPGFDAVAAITDAIDDWKPPVDGLSTQRDLGLTDGTVAGCQLGVDVEIVVRPGGGRIQGTTSFESAGGLITGTQIVVRGKFSGAGNDEATVKLIARHEFGHVLGLGHWNIPDLLMSEQLNATHTIDACEAAAVVAVQGWYFDSAGGPAPYAGPDPYDLCDPT